MIKKIIDFSGHNKFLIIVVTLFLMWGGFHSLKNIPMDAIPDLSDTQVIIYSKWERSPDLIEKQITYPLISGMVSLPKVKTVRGMSDYGNSFIYVIFEDGTDLYWARSRVLEYLNTLKSTLPTDAAIELGPDATSVGWVFQYVLFDETHTHNLTDLRSYQDYVLKYEFLNIKGVSEVASLGGYKNSIQINIDPAKLLHFRVNFKDVIRAVSETNNESGGRTIEYSGMEAMVRSRGQVLKLSDIENAVVSFSSASWSPVRVQDLGSVTYASDSVRGVSDFNGLGNTVSGTIIMRDGEDAPSVIKRVKERIDDLKKSLPSGVKIIPVYDRSDLIHRAIDTLKTTLLEELIVVSLIILLFLWHIPSALVPIITIPITVLLSFIPLYLLGFSSNIMSLSGIAISIGVLVDGAIIEVENAYRKIEHWMRNGRKGDFHEVRLSALKEVGPSVFFSLLLISVSFLPIFTLVEEEGRLFSPLAFSKTFVMVIAAILAITLDPAVRMLFSRSEKFRTKYSLLNYLGNLFLVGNYYKEERHPISRVLFKIYRPAVHFSLKYKKIILLSSFLLTLSIIPGLNKLGHEFMPELNEGTILYMPTALPGISITEAQNVLIKQDQIIKSFPEVKTVFGKAGRAETSTDTAPMSMIETTIVLKEESLWRTKKRFYSSYIKPLRWFFNFFVPEKITYHELVDELNAALKFPGMPNIWTMPIRNRIDMLSSGMRSPLGIKIYGDDLPTLQKIGEKIESLLKPHPASRSVVSERETLGTYLDIDFNRNELMNLGLSLLDAQEQAMGAIGGVTTSYTLYSRERFPIRVRYHKDFRSTKDDIESILITSPDGHEVALKDIAEVKFTDGASMIRDENARLVNYVYIDVNQDVLDIGHYIEEAKELLSQNIELPLGYRLEWSGSYENMNRVFSRLKIILPLTLFLIVFLLYLNTKSWVKTGIVILAIPFSLIGAIWFMNGLDYNMSIAVWVGMIALMGLDAETGVFMLMYLDLSFDEFIKKGKMNNLADLEEAVIDGAVHRIRPKLMTVTTLFIGLIPIMWSIGSGSDVMKRIAAPMIGGVFSSFFLELIIYPLLFYIWKGRSFLKKSYNEIF